MTFVTSKIRWDRRTNLKQASLVNCFSKNPGWADFIEDKNGITIGSKGYFQDMLFYITDKLNLTIGTIESPWDMELLDSSRESSAGTSTSVDR